MLLGALAAVMLAAGTVPVPAAVASPCVYLARGADFTGGRPPVAVNALGYDPGRDLYYAVAGGTDLATITRDGRLTVLAPVPRGLMGAHVGTITGGEWLIANNAEFVAIDPRTLAVKRRVWFSDRLRIGDWDAWQGSLFGLDTRGPRGPRLARIDPGTGRVFLSNRLEDLPGDGSYGGVVIDQGGTLHALHNASGRMFHLPLAAPETATATDAGPRAESSDAAPCPRALPPPPPPPPPPAPSPPVPSPPVPSPTPPPPTISPVPRPSLPPSPTPTPPASPSPTPTVMPESEVVATVAAAQPVPKKTRLLFLGVMIPALAVAARSAARRR